MTHQQLDKLSTSQLYNYIKTCHAKIGEAYVGDHLHGKFKLDGFEGDAADKQFERYCNYIQEAKRIISVRRHKAFTEGSETK